MDEEITSLKLYDNPENQNLDLSSSKPEFNLNQILKKVDQFIENLSPGGTKFTECIEPLLDLVESKVVMYEKREASYVFGQNKQEDTSFFEAVGRLSIIVTNLDMFASDSVAASPCSNRAGSLHHRVMLLSEYEFRALLDTTIPIRNSNADVEHDTKRDDDEYPYYSAESIGIMNRLATAMIFAGYEAECCMVYSGTRLRALDVELSRQSFENINVDDVQKMSWESLEEEIFNWISITKHCTVNLFAGERKLCDSVFSENPSTAKTLFCDLVTFLATRLLNFPNALVLPSQYSTEKLFKFLDIYETLRDLSSLDIGNDSSSSAEEFTSETSMAQCRIGETAVSIFSELENSIKSDNAGRIPVASGVVHPLTRYTMNYLEYACEYKDTLEQVFRKHDEMKGSSTAGEKIEEPDPIETDDRCLQRSPLASRLTMVMDLLDDNIELKSKLYTNPALRYVFLMNNGRYILQKIKESTDIYEMMGHSWRRKRTTELRRYHKQYQRQSWTRVLEIISHEGIQVKGKVSKLILKERFKNFNALFDDILKTQSTWVVSDGQLRSELRVSISSLVIPAYRSFVGRYKAHFDKKEAGKYIKYQPEDIEECIEQLFDGNTTSMSASARRT